jgi:hypothetical protein
MANPLEIEKILDYGAQKARLRAKENMEKIREALGVS